jgi:hypothetical protein
MELNSFGIFRIFVVGLDAYEITQRLCPFGTFRVLQVLPGVEKNQLIEERIFAYIKLSITDQMDGSREN